jgi:hypothetical protein
LLSIALHFSSGQSSDIPKPAKTTLLNQKKQMVSSLKVVTYTFSSELSKEELIKFYRNSFTASGMRESAVRFSDEPGEKALFFEQPPLKNVNLFFMSAPTEGQTSFEIVVEEVKQLPLLQEQVFTAPQKLDFMPTYANAKQFVSAPFVPPGKGFGAGYFTHSLPEEVTNFFTTQMPSYDWTLSKNEPKQGEYGFYEWLRIVDPFTIAIPILKERQYEKIVKPLKLRGTTLTFTNGEETCVVTIYRFEDILSKAQGTVWDVSSLQKYGTTLICAYYLP